MHGLLLIVLKRIASFEYYFIRVSGIGSFLVILNIHERRTVTTLLKTTKNRKVHVFRETYGDCTIVHIVYFKHY